MKVLAINGISLITALVVIFVITKIYPSQFDDPEAAIDMALMEASKRGNSI